ncbi:hypothetical protein B0H67DRAFT_467533, partial [Lasiosphaeris hirsuta]
QPQPTFQGTFGILSTCLVTLGLYVWSAIHLNMPARNEAPWDFICATSAWKKVAFTAYQQYRTVKSLSKAKNYEWTIVHSYFALMRGYEVRIEPADQNFLPRTRVLDEEREGLRLIAEGFQALAQNFPDLIPDQPREKIDNKSKGDAIAKNLVCFQAVWFCAQCFARLGQRLGISLLELNTLGYALCALLIYCLWWNKPLDVREP